MIQFEDLPRTHRTLLVATLELEIAEAKCTNILELAHKRNLPIQDIWRDVCRRTGQPRCTVPAAVMVSRDQWLGAATSRHADAASAPPAMESSPPASAKEAPPPASVQDGGATADTITAAAVPAKEPRAAPAPAGAPRARDVRVPLMAGLVAGLVAGLALGGAFFFLAVGPNPPVAPQASLQVPNVKAGDAPRGVTVIRERTGENAQPPFDPASLPPPQGTIRRLDGISKSFLNR